VPSSGKVVPSPFMRQCRQPAADAALKRGFNMRLSVKLLATLDSGEQISLDQHRRLPAVLKLTAWLMPPAKQPNRCSSCLPRSLICRSACRHQFICTYHCNKFTISNVLAHDGGSLGFFVMSVSMLILKFERSHRIFQFFL
jgi:hypothetical protein